MRREKEEALPVGRQERCEMRLGNEAEAGPGELIKHARESGFICKII